MDRKDERRDNRADDALESQERSGDVLGLSGTAVPKSPGDPTASNDPASVAHRRDRMRGTDTVESGAEHGAGATGIDMGSGGGGTDIGED